MAVSGMAFVRRLEFWISIALAGLFFAPWLNVPSTGPVSGYALSSWAAQDLFGQKAPAFLFQLGLVLPLLALAAAAFSVMGRAGARSVFSCLAGVGAYMLIAHSINDLGLQTHHSLTGTGWLAILVGLGAMVVPVIAKDRAGLFRNVLEGSGMLLVFIALYLVLAVFVPKFMTLDNTVALTLSVTTIGMVACTMMFCLAAGDFDLSVGSQVAFSGVVAAVIMSMAGKTAVAVFFGQTLWHFTYPSGNGAIMFLGIGAALVACGLVGLLNGFVIARIGINALITTLATMQIVRGLGFIVSDGSAVSVGTPGFGSLGNAAPLGLAMPVWILIGSFVVFGLLLNRTTFGRNSLAIGGNMEASRLAGINVPRTKILIFTLQGLMCGFTGVILASRLASGQPNSSSGLELQVISACVLGGVSMTGGVATITGVVVGVLIMGAVQDAMNLLNWPTFYQYVASGAVLLAAVMVDRLKQRRG